MPVFLYFQSLTLDNASADDVLCRTLSPLLEQRYQIHFVPENGQIRCLAHVVNLVVQTFLKHLDEVQDDPEVNDYYDQNKSVPFHYDPEEDDELCAFESEEAMEEDERVAADIVEALDAAENRDGACEETSVVKKVTVPYPITLRHSTQGYLASDYLSQNRELASASVTLPKVCTPAVW